MSDITALDVFGKYWSQKPFTLDAYIRTPFKEGWRKSEQQTYTEQIDALQRYFKDNLGCQDGKYVWEQKGTTFRSLSHAYDKIQKLLSEEMLKRYLFAYQRDAKRTGFGETETKVPPRPSRQAASIYQNMMADIRTLIPIWTTCNKQPPFEVMRDVRRAIEQASRREDEGTLTLALEAPEFGRSW
jgi:hypothetical protein